MWGSLTSQMSISQMKQGKGKSLFGGHLQSVTVFIQIYFIVVNSQKRLRTTGFMGLVKSSPAMLIYKQVLTSCVRRDWNESCHINLICEHITASFYQLKNNMGHPKKLSAVQGHLFPLQCMNLDHAQMPLVYCVPLVFQISVYITLRSGNVMWLWEEARSQVLSPTWDLIPLCLLNNLC